MRRTVPGLLILSSLLSSSTALAAVADARYLQSTYATGVSETTGMAWAPDGSARLFLAVKSGQVRVVEGGVLRPTPFSTDTVRTNDECGLIGLAFDPDYVSNRFVYLFLTVSASEQQIVRYTDRDGVGADRTVVVSRLPTRGNNHNGGAIGFGADGKLYWAIGDLGNGTGVDADLVSLAAKVARSNRDGTPANDNPFNDGVGPNNEYIWARGFRNPFTFAFRPGTGALWVNSVGTNYEQVFSVSRGAHAGYDDYENNQPAGYLAPLMAYRTNGSDTRHVTANGAMRAGGVATFTTTGAHGFRVGGRVALAVPSDASFDGVFPVASVPSATTFTVTQVGPEASSGGGTATTEHLGGSITGGAFYDATLLPPEDRGAFFFGDFNSGKVHRVAVDSGGLPEDVGLFASGISNAVDVAVGPDGALYAVGVMSGLVYRFGVTEPAPGIVVSSRHLRGLEGGRVAFAVSLAVAPATDTVVTVAKTSGDEDLSVEGPTTLRFTPANWNVPQPVVVHAADDADSVDDVATFTVSADGLASQEVFVSVKDEPLVAPVLSTAELTVAEGGSAVFTVALMSQPSMTVTVIVGRVSGDADVAISSATSLTFTPSNWNVAQSVTVAAAADGDLDDDAAVVRVTATAGRSRDVAVTVHDTTTLAPQFVSTPPLVAAVVGVPYRYDAVAIGQPTPTYALLAKPTGAGVDATTGVVMWTPETSGIGEFRLEAANAAGTAEQAFEVAVQDDEPPTAVLTRPLSNEVIAGDQVPFYGEGIDDVGTVRAEFTVNGAVHFVDEQTSGHYRFGGEGGVFDATDLAPGLHVLRMTVFDTAGQSGFAEVTVSVADAPDAGTDVPDAGTDVPDGGCGCTAGGAGSLPLLGWLFVASRMARRRRL